MNASHIPSNLQALLIDDHPVVMDALATALVTMRLFNSVDKVKSLGQARERLAGHSGYALAILDLNLGDACGLDTLDLMREAFPDLPILVFSGDDSADTIGAAFERGVRGFVPKDSPLDVVINAVRMVLAGSSYIPPHVVRSLGVKMPDMPAIASAGERTLASLSPRQKQVLELLLVGMPNKVIGSRLGMAEGTVKTHLNTVYRLIGAQNRAQAILRSRELGFL